MFIYRTIHRLLDTNSSEDQPRSSRPCSGHTKEGIKRIPEKIKRKLWRSANKMIAEENVNRRTMQVIINEDEFLPN